MPYCSALSFAAKWTKIEDVLCRGIIRERGHNILSIRNQAKIVKALTCYLCIKVHPGLFGSLLRSNNGFRLKLYSQKLKNGVIVKSDVKNNSHLFVVRHSFDCSLMQK